MKEFKYPIRVIEKRMSNPKFKPFAVDTRSGEHLKISYHKANDILYGLIQTIVLALALTAGYFILAEPLVKTLDSKIETNDIISNFGGNDYHSIKKLETQAEVLERVYSNGTLRLTIKTNDNNHKDILGIIFGISGLKEVYSDGNNIAITIVSSEK